MIRIVHIARYGNPMMERKIDLMAEEEDLFFFRIRPSGFRDPYGHGPSKAFEGPSCLHVPLIGRSDDPHRTLYRTLTFRLRSYRPDIIHAEEEPDSLSAFQILLAKRLLSPAAALILHTWQNVDRPKKRHVAAVLKATLSGSDAVLCANEEAARILSRKGYTRPIEVIPQQGVDTSVFKPVNGAETPRRFAVVFAGRFVREKGLDTLFDAVSRINEPVHLLLVGSGPEQEGLENRIRTMKPPHSAEIVAPREQIDMARIYAGTHALVLPSRSTKVWKEQFGRVLVEAMACAVPVIGSDSGAIPEIVGPDGLIFKEGDVEDLARCLSKLIESPVFRNNLGSRGYFRATTIYSQEHVAARTAAFYRRVIKERGAV
jgi:L-malate glycosyltransferase